MMSMEKVNEAINDVGHGFGGCGVGRIVVC